MARWSDARRCAFCGAAGTLHKEHVWPEWLARVSTNPKESIRYTQAYIDRAGVSRQRSWSARPFQHKVTAVCRGCNSGWMSDLEQRAVPILRPPVSGHACSLDAAAQSIAALRAVKTTMMAQFTHPLTRTIPPPDYAWLYEHRCPPPNHQVWIGARPKGAGEWPFLYRGVGLTIAPVEAAVEDFDTNGHRTTLAVGHLVLHLSSHTLDDGPVLQFGEGGERALIPIWPPSSTSNWPPPDILGTRALEGLTPELDEDARPVTLGHRNAPYTWRLRA